MRRRTSESGSWAGKELKRIPDELLRDGVRQAKLDLSDNPGLQLCHTDLSRLANVHELALRGCGLQQLPDELAILKKLSSLDVSRNDLASLPNCVWSFEQLKTLNVSENALTSLPSIGLPQQVLLSLDVSKNKITALPQTIYYLGALKTLNLGYNLLDRLPDDIWRLSQMETLIIQNNAFVQLPTRMWRQPSLLTLDARNNMLSSLPRDLFQMPKLQKLAVDGNEALTTIHVHLIFHERIQELTVDIPLRGSHSLPDLRIFNEDFERRSEAVSRLKTKLELRLDTNQLELNLHNSGLTELDTRIEDIGSLKTLTAVDFSKNDLETLPAALWTMSQIERLNVFGNTRLLSIPGEVTALFRLKEFNAGSCSLSQLQIQLHLFRHLACIRLSCNPQLRTFPTSIFLLGGSLIELDISFCGLTVLPREIAKLQLLKVMDISTNELTELPMELGSLKSIETLRAANNNFSSFPEAVLSLGSLVALDLSNNLRVSGHPCTNSITELPVNLLSLSLLSKLELRQNPMRVPPSAVCDQGLAAVRAYLADASAGRARLCVATFSLVGETGAGKTSLMRSLECGRPCITTAEDRTRVMDQRRLPLAFSLSSVGGLSSLVECDDGAGVAVFNDFGGHAIYQTVLPVLLPPGGVVVLVYDVTSSNPEDTVDKWLTTTLALAPRTRMIVVGTHCDLLLPDNNFAAAAAAADRMARFCHAKMAKIIEELSDHERDARLDVERCSELADDYPSTGRALTHKLLCLRQSLNDVRAAVEAAERWPPIVISCAPRDDYELKLLDRLRTVLLQAAPPPAVLPASWCLFIRELLGPADGCGMRQATTYLTMSEIQALFTIHFPSESDRSKLGFILTYLAETSQIIWLQGHPQLSSVVFHRVDHVIDIFKAVLSHDDLSKWEGSGRYASDVDQYKSGFLTESLLHKLLEPHVSSDCQVSVLADLLVQFRVISLLDGTSRPRVYVIPSNLPQTPSSVVPPLGRLEPVRMHAQFSFFGAVVPLAFFETSLVIVLQHMEQLQQQPAAPAAMSRATCWRDGVCFRRNGVSVACERARTGSATNGTTFDIRASSVHVRSLWYIMRPLLHDLILYLATSWKGAWYDLFFWCPSCEYRSSSSNPIDSSDNSPGRWKYNVNYDILENLLQSSSDIAGDCVVVGPNNAETRHVGRRQLVRNVANGSRYLSHEWHREWKQPVEFSQFCSSCSLDVPLCLLTVCCAEDITDNDVKRVSNFLSDIAGADSGNGNDQVLYHTTVDKSVSYVLLKDLMRESEGVGMICCPELRATGFRIGSRHLLTAKHVAVKLIPDKDRSLKYSQSLLSSHDREVFVVFKYNKSFMTLEESTVLGAKCNLAVSLSQKQWQAAGLTTVAFSGSFVLLEGLDAAVLELGSVACSCESGCADCGNLSLPPPLSCAVSELQVTNVESVYVIGHPDGKPKQLDVKCGIVKQSRGEQLALGSDSSGPPALSGRELIMYHSALNEGASGAPVLGVPAGSQRPVVIAMHVCGFPVVAIDTLPSHNYSLQARNKQKFYKGGVRIDCILRYLKEHHTDIYEDIANHSGLLAAT